MVSEALIFKNNVSTNFTVCQDHQAEESAVKCLSQGNNKNARVGFEPRPC